MEADKELTALIRVNQILSTLDDGSLTRVLQWILGKYGSVTTNKSLNVAKFNSTPKTSPHDNFPTLAGLLAETSPKTEPQWFLLAAYWYSNGNLETTFHSSDLTALLKEAGYIIKKVSNAIDSLKKTKPMAYLIQIAKNSKTKGKNGRLTLKLTPAGIKAAEEFINDRTQEQ